MSKDETIYDIYVFDEDDDDEEGARNRKRGHC